MFHVAYVQVWNFVLCQGLVLGALSHEPEIS